MCDMENTIVRNYIFLLWIAHVCFISTSYCQLLHGCASGAPTEGEGYKRLAALGILGAV